MKSLLAIAVLGLAIGAAAAADTEAGERSRIAQQRSEAQARFDSQQKLCHQQFAVTACVDAARAERRKTIDDLTIQERVLDDAARKRRAAQRLAEIEARQKAPLQPLKPERQVVTRDGEAASAPRRLETPHPASAPRPVVVNPAQQREIEATKRAAFEERQRAAQAHREESEKRQQELVKKKPPLAIAPLPTPSAAAASVAAPASAAR